ncbi:MAG: ABC transporter permease [Candidatus Diapherotrites archaeon]|uniref:ABC transporter permease n=1 Tax=Candidatus Iainarchaeum sp. TaxID=3101447 RepID=A0A8T4C7T6_9ARCH|nr:ABC transporter permease [Candidatus Diapherotrites archaeon]
MNPLLDAPAFALRNLTHQGFRSLLTLLGVIIGIAAIVTLFSLGAGLTNAVNEQFEQLGANTVYVMPSGLLSGSSGNASTNVKTLSSSLIDRIHNLSEVEEVISNVYSQGTVTVGHQNERIYILSISPDELQSYVNTGFLSLREGRLFSSRDTFTAILGNQLVDDRFEKDVRLGSKILIEGKSFSVVGVTAPAAEIAGDPASVNNSIFIPSKGFNQLFEETDPLFLIVKTNAVEEVPLAVEKITRLLDKEFGRDQKVFEAVTTEQLQEQVGALIGVIQIVLVGVASISLLVGGVGIANTMVMSVLERTNEIGVMKAVGATTHIVLAVFLLEAGFIGALGGLIGLIIGYSLAFLVGYVANSMNFALSIYFDPFVALFALLFALLVGMVAGFLPARRAARMDPVDALRA